jgi:ubiquinone/menaquinone biosynthesis C-methylase UbiE
VFSDPRKNIEQLGLTPGMKVADLGAGSGFYTYAAAFAVGDRGRIYAVDIQKDLLAKLKNEATKQHLYNVETIWGDLEKVGGTRLQEKMLDAVIVSNVLFQIQDKSAFLKEVERIIKPGREVMLVDWSDASTGLGPKNDQIVTESSAKKLFADHGFEFVRNIQTGDHHYGLIFKGRK